MADKLSDVLNKLAEKKNGDFKEVVCPSCAAKILLYAKMQYGYCRFCAGKVSQKDAQSRNFSKQLIEYLSYEENYSLMREGEEEVDENVAKIAVEKGSLTAALDLGWLYFDKEDFENAMHYFEIAKDGGNNDGKEMYPLAALGLGNKYVINDDYKTAMPYFKIAKNCGNNDAKAQYLICKDRLILESGDLTLSKCRKMLYEIADFDHIKLSEPCREMLNNVRNVLKKTIEDEGLVEKEREEKERKERERKERERKERERRERERKEREREEKERIARYVSTSSSSYSSSSGEQSTKEWDDLNFDLDMIQSMHDSDWWVKD